MADTEPGPEGEAYLDKGLSWDKRLQLAREKRAKLLAENGPTRVTPKLKPWESETEPVDEAPAPVVPEYPDVPAARRAAILARMKADAARQDARPAVKVLRLTQPQDTGAQKQPPEIRVQEAPISPDDALAAVNRLLTAPPAADGAAGPSASRADAVSGARFQSIPGAEAQRRSWVLVVALACLLGGLIAGLLLAAALFFTIGAQVRGPASKPAALAGKAPGSTTLEAVPSTGRAMVSPQGPPAPDLPALAGAQNPAVSPFAATARAEPPSLPVPPAPDENLARLRANAPLTQAAVPPMANPSTSDVPPAFAGFAGQPQSAANAALGSAPDHDVLPRLAEVPAHEVTAPEVTALAPALSTEAPLPVERIAFVSADTAPARIARTRALVAAKPDAAFACAGCTLTSVTTADKTVRLRLPTALAGNERRLLRDLLTDAGFMRVVPAIERMPVRTSQVRYFRPEDADAARLLADMTRAELFDLSWFAPRPAEGTIEVLIAVDGVSGALPPG